MSVVAVCIRVSFLLSRTSFVLFSPNCLEISFFVAEDCLFFNSLTMSNVDVPGDLAKKDFNTSVVFCLILK